MFNEIKEVQNNKGRVETLRDEPDLKSGREMELDQEFNSSDEEEPYEKWSDEDEDEGLGMLDTLCNLLDIKKTEVKPPAKSIVAQIPNSKQNFVLNPPDSAAALV